MGTFHALCARVLRRDGAAIGLDPHFVVYDTDDQQALMKQILREEDLPITGEYKPSAILGAISRAKNEMIDADFLVQNAHTHREREIARLFRRYQARLRSAAALDFDDLLLEAVRLFQEAPAVLERYQAPVALSPHRRVPGHEPPAVSVGQGARGGAPQRLRRGRRRPVDLLLARRRHPQHPGLRARLPRCHRREARAELPLHAADPGRRACGRHQQLVAQGQEALDGELGRPADLPVRGLQRGRGGGVDRAPDRGADRRSGHDPDPSRRRGGRALGAARHRGHVPHQRPEPRHRRGVPALQHPLPARGRDALLPAPRGQGRAGVSADPAQRRRPGQLRARAQRPRAGARREEPRGAARVRRRGRARAGGGGPGHLLGCGAGCRRGPHRGAGTARPGRPRRVRRAGGPAADQDRSAGPARAAGRGTGGVGIPGHARRRLRGGRGALGEPARAALRHDALRRPGPGRRPGSGSWRRRPSSPTRIRTRPAPTRSR